MKIRPKNPKNWKSALDALETFVEEGDMLFDENGMRIQSWNAGRVVLIDVVFKRAAFSLFDVDETARVRLNLSDLAKVLKRWRAKETVTLEYDDVGREVRIILAHGKKKRTFSLKTYETTGDEFIDLGDILSGDIGEFVMDGKKFKETIGDAKIIAEDVAFEMDDDGLVMSGDDVAGSFRDEYPPSEFESFKCGEYCMSKFTLASLEKVAAELIADTVSVRLGNGSPVLFDSVNDDARVTVIIAPLMESTFDGEDFDENLFD